MNVEGRHPAVVDIAQYFAWDHLPPHLQEVSHAVAELAEKMIADLPDCPMLTRGLDNLLTAKDCFVRAALRRAD
ncbi:hypothetical protein [Frankia sp. Cj3]|uniref:hypothetical protein n=1 Tax=Frankia sp. Cj3 TaxID=2880976 RepID=UPI001EF694E4|nr:hypothetical protein [Frankia sp. Cj3]